MEKKDKDLQAPDITALSLPAELASFIEQGKSTFRCDDGDWDVRVEEPVKGIPEGSVVIANNGCGDFLFLAKLQADPQTLSRSVHVFWHDENRTEPFADDIAMLTDPPPAAPSGMRPVHYHGGDVAVRLGDEVSARSIIFRKEGRVVYVPGVSKKNRSMEHGGLCWVGIKFSDGTLTGTIVDPDTFQLKKGVRFIKRSSETVDGLGPDEDFD